MNNGVVQMHVISHIQIKIIQFCIYVIQRVHRAIKSREVPQYTARAENSPCNQPLNLSNQIYHWCTNHIFFTLLWYYHFSDTRLSRHIFLSSSARVRGHAVRLEFSQTVSWCKIQLVNKSIYRGSIYCVDFLLHIVCHSKQQWNIHILAWYTNYFIQ